MSSDFLDRLTQDLKPVRRGAMATRVLLAAIAATLVSAVIMMAWLGPRPDMAVAVATPIFWIKFAYTLGATLIGLWMVLRLGRPISRARGPLVATLLLFTFIAASSALEVASAPPDLRRALVMGSSALLCPFYIMALSVPVLLGNLLMLRRLAPTNLPLAGLAAGLLAGAAGSWVYSFHCTEEALPFLALWYSLGIAVVAVVGAALGRWALRW